MSNKPNVSSDAQKELEKTEQQFQKFDEDIKSMTLDRLNAAPREEAEPQTKLSQQEISRAKDIYLKPKRAIGSREKFNENYRKEYEEAKEYVHFIAENKEIIGETLEFWTKPFAGLAAEEWAIPCGKPVWAPRYVAEQIKRKFYHRLTMQNTTVGTDHAGQYYGTMAVDTTIQRLDAIPVSSRKSIFMGANSF